MESSSSSSSSLSGSYKRVKAPGNVSSQVVVAHCLVDGCNADLSLCREYHRRHKVCEPHSKASRVTIGGREQRFCQQCSRFHSLAEFDEGKRSCRKRLDGHNRRRRKPQPEIPRNSGLLFSTSQGTRLLSFSSSPPPPLQQMIFPSAVVSSTWAAGHVVKPPESSSSSSDILPYNNNQSSNMSYVEERETTFSPEPSSSVHGYNKLGVNHFQFQFQFQFMQSTLIDQQHEVATAASSICKPLIDQKNSRSVGNHNHNHNHNHTNSGQKKIFCDGLNNQVIHSDRALSLLSSAPAVTSSREITGFSTPIPMDMVDQPADSSSSISPQSSLLVHNMHSNKYNNNIPCHFPFAPPPPPENETSNKSETLSQVSFSNTTTTSTTTTTLHFQDMFQQNGPPPPPSNDDDDDDDESTTTTTTTTGSHHHTHTFLWE